MISRQKMPLNQTKEEGEKLRDSEDLEGNKKKEDGKKQRKNNNNNNNQI